MRFPSYPMKPRDKSQATCTSPLLSPPWCPTSAPRHTIDTCAGAFSSSPTASRRPSPISKRLPTFNRITLQPGRGWPSATALAPWMGTMIRASHFREEMTATRALALDPSLPEAHIAMAGLLLLGHWDWVHADQEVLRAIDLDPRFAEPYHLLARILIAAGRGEEAIAVQKKQMELDPFARPWGMAETYYNVRQYDAAISDARLRLENSPSDVRLHSFIALGLADQGKYKEASEVWAKLFRVANAPQAAAAVERAYQAGGYRAVVLWQLRSAEKEARNHYLSPVALARLYAE